MNILNIVEAEQELQHYAARTRYRQVTNWVMTVARNQLFIREPNEFVVYSAPEPGELSELPTVDELPDWAKRDLSDGKPIHVFNTVHAATRPFWKTLADCIKWLNCIQPYDPLLERLDRMSYEQVAKKAGGWATDVNENPWLHIKDMACTFYDFGDGWRIAVLQKPVEFEREGELMHHCVAGPTYQTRAQSGLYLYLSLRDPHNVPHATVEVQLEPYRFALETMQELKRVGVAVVLQIRGNSNKALKPEHDRRMKAFMAQTQWVQQNT